MLEGVCVCGGGGVYGMIKVCSSSIISGLAHSNDNGVDAALGTR